MNYDKSLQHYSSMPAGHSTECQISEMRLLIILQDLLFLLTMANTRVWSNPARYFRERNGIWTTNGLWTTQIGWNSVDSGSGRGSGTSAEWDWCSRDTRNVELQTVPLFRIRNISVKNWSISLTVGKFFLKNCPPPPPQLHRSKTKDRH